MTISELSKSSKIEENTAVYVVNGCWTGYIVRDCVTDDLHLFIPIPNSKRNGIKTFEQGSTYEDVFPNDNIRIYDTEEKSFSNLPFEVGTYAADEESIYEIIGSSKNKSLVTSGPIELVKVKVKDLATEETSVKNVSELHIHGFNEEFNDSLIKLTRSSNPAVKAYLKAAYLYSKNFKEMIDHAEGMLALENDSNFMALLKNVCEKSSSKRLNTRGEYFVNGDDIQFYTSIEDDKVVTCKIKNKVEGSKMILLNRDERTAQEYRELLKPILDKYKTSLSGAIQILHEPYGILRTRYFQPYREPDSVQLEDCAIFEKRTN
jgi:hypothetical protein